LTYKTLFCNNFYTSRASMKRRFIAVWWNRLLVKAAQVKMRFDYSKVLNAARSDYGLPSSRRTPVLDFLTAPRVEMALYSPVFAADQGGERAITVTGFPVPAAEPFADDPELAGFLADAPIVFSLGSILSQNPGQFYVQSVAAARAVGRKALLLTQHVEGIPDGPDVLVRGFVPHAEVFPKASVVVHHGGIGTTGQALMAGKPQLVVPHFGDQPDNAARLVRLGVARSLTSTEYDDRSAAEALKALLSQTYYAEKAEHLADVIRPENGAQGGADVILRVLADRQPF